MIFPKSINIDFSILIMWIIPSGFCYSNQVVFMLINKQFQFYLFITQAPIIGV